MTRQTIAPDNYDYQTTPLLIYNEIVRYRYAIHMPQQICLVAHAF